MLASLVAKIKRTANSALIVFKDVTLRHSLLTKTCTVPSCPADGGEAHPDWLVSGLDQGVTSFIPAGHRRREEDHSLNPGAKNGTCPKESTNSRIPYYSSSVI